MINESRKDLVMHLKKQGYIKSSSVEKAFLKIPREQFISSIQKKHAYDDTPLRIGKGQTISAPHMVAIMCEALDIRPNQKILEIGAGSGYHAAIVSQIVGKNGYVFSIERIESLAEQAINNLQKVGIENVTVKIGDGSIGLHDFAPFDRIYITCAAPKLPPPLIDQVVDSGKILVPEGDMLCSLKLYEKRNNDLITHNFGGCVFVPLIGEYGH
jgi:protein-L-isoaspartate(D-aspartate) O-methyltransferase